MMARLFSKIPFSRLALYLLIVALLPLVGIGYFYVGQMREWEAVEAKMLSLAQLSQNKARRQYLNMAVRKNFAEVDSLYLENQLEPLSFLKSEREALEKFIQNPAFTGNEAAERRLAFLKSGANKLEWTSSPAQSAEGVQEIAVSLSHPIQVDAQDLKEILTRLEGNRKAKPQLIITDFYLLKKPLKGGQEIFELNLKLLKREFA